MNSTVEMTSWPPEIYLTEAVALGREKTESESVNRMWQEVIAPILGKGNIEETFRKKREEYLERREARTAGEKDLEGLMSEEDNGDQLLRLVLMWHEKDLGDRVLRAVLGGIDLKKIVRRSILPHSESWPEESWSRIGHLLANNELCNLAIIYHLATSEGERGRIETLAAWGFQYAMDAYWDAGYYGTNSTKLEDIPE